MFDEKEFTISEENRNDGEAWYRLAEDFAYRLHDHEKAHVCITKSAELDYAAAWEWLAYHHEHRQAYEQAVVCMTKAAELGSVLACLYLGDYYREGQGVPQDYVKAAEYYATVAAYQEYLVSDDYCPQSNAAYHIGTFHDQGLLPDASPEQAALWYDTAAQNADDTCRAEPLIKLAWLHLEGRGVEQSDGEAYSLCYSAAMGGYIHQENGPLLFALCARLLDSETVTANKENQVFLLEQMATLCEKGWGGAVSPDQADAYRDQAADIRRTYALDEITFSESPTLSNQMEFADGDLLLDFPF